MVKNAKATAPKDRIIIVKRDSETSAKFIAETFQTGIASATAADEKKQANKIALNLKEKAVTHITAFFICKFYSVKFYISKSDNISSPLRAKTKEPTAAMITTSVPAKRIAFATVGVLSSKFNSVNKKFQS